MITLRPVFAELLLHVVIVALVLQMASPSVQRSWRTALAIESLEPSGVGFEVDITSVVPRSSRPRADPMVYVFSASNLIQNYQ